MERLLIVSADGHAVMPPELWAEYLEPEFHEHLPRLSGENGNFARVQGILSNYDHIYEGVLPEGTSHYDVFDTEGLYAAGQWAGAWDRDVRLAQMDHEGIAAEFVFNGFFRATDMFFNVSNTVYPDEVNDAGVRAYDRWLYDTFGSAADRLLLVGAIGRCLDLDATMREATWIADHDFTGSYMPGFVANPDLPPLDDAHWDPYWALCAERGLALIVHGGYGFEQGMSYGALTQTYERVKSAGGSDLDVVRDLRSGMFNDSFFADIRNRRALWQMMLGGVFDRHPDLRVMMTEVRADWVPAVLGRLDAAFEEHRDDLPATRKPSEYWHSNCMAGLSFMHRSEVEMRDEIGIDTIAFGRDYPHSEGTWPNTLVYLQTLFAGVPEHDARLILGESAAQFLGLDRDHLETIVERIGFAADDVLGNHPEMESTLRDHLDARCGLSKPAEGASRLDQIEAMLQEDLDRVGAR